MVRTLLVVVFAGLVMWAGEVAHAAESVAQLPGAADAEGLTPAEADDGVRHLDEGGGGRRGDGEPGAVVPTPGGVPASATWVPVSPRDGSVPDERPHATPDARGPPGST